MGSKWIQGAVKHPGALTEAAKRNGRSKEEEAEVESHSSDPSIRSRGNLGKRFMGTAKKGNFKSPKKAEKVPEVKSAPKKRG